VWQCEVVKERVGGLDVYDLAPNEIRSTRIQRSSASTFGHIEEACQQRLAPTKYQPFQAMVIGLELGQITPAATPIPTPLAQDLFQPFGEYRQSTTSNIQCDWWYQCPRLCVDGMTLGRLQPRPTLSALGASRLSARPRYGTSSRSPSPIYRSGIRGARVLIRTGCLTGQAILRNLLFSQ
jgi:hypothetical protein